MNIESEVFSVDTPNLTIKYRKAGTGDTPLVFLHGNYASSRWWLPQLERLPENTTAYAPDFRGCGSKNGITTTHNKQSSPLVISDLSNDLHEFISILEINKPILIGHSLGGIVALDYSLRFKDQVHCLVLEDTGPPNNVSLIPFPGMFFIPLELGGKAVIKRTLRLAGLTKKGSFSKALISDALAGKTGQYLAFTQAVLNWDVADKLADLNLPVFLIWGQKDLIMPPRIGKSYLKRLPNSKLSIIDNAGHTPHLEKPDSFAAELTKFIHQNCD